MEKTIQQKQQELMDELYRSFDFFNDYFCKGKLPRPLITIQGDKSKRTLGWFGAKFWGGTGLSKEEIDELNLTAEAMHREPTHVLETLLHEMAHLKNASENIKDCTATQYHNEAFKKTAEFFGLEVSKMQGKGWAQTNLGPDALLAIEILKPQIDKYCIVRKPPQVLKKDPTTISLQVDISFEEKISFLEGVFGKKRALAEEAINQLYDKHAKKEELDDLEVEIEKNDDDIEFENQ